MANDEQTADAALTTDLARVGLVVTAISRSPERLIVVTRTARNAPLVAVVGRGVGEHDLAFLRLMTKAATR